MKVLLVKLGAIGDVIQTAAALEYYRLKRPLDCVDWVVGRSVSGLASVFDVANVVHIVDDRKLFHGGLVARIPALLREAVCIAKACKKYDLIVIPYMDVRYRALTAFVRAKKTRMFSRSAKRNAVLPSRNRVFECYRLLAGEEDREMDVAALMYRIGEKIREDNAKNGRKGVITGPYVVLCPGGAKNLVRSDALRRWPLSKYRQLAERLIAAGVIVVIAGGQTDGWVVEGFAKLPVINMVGKTDLFQLWMLLAAASVVVSHDSGPLHMAITTHSGVVALFGPTPESAIVPRGRERTVSISVGNRIACSPCYDGQSYAPCMRPICMEMISVERVFTAVMNMQS